MTRDALDRFYTEQPLADAIVRRCVLEAYLQAHAMSYVLEPHSGRGAFVRAVRQQAPAAWVTAVDIDPAAERWAKPGPPGSAGGQVWWICADFMELAADVAEEDGYDLVIGNPPYARPVEGRSKPQPCVLEHVQAGLRCLNPGGRLVFLVRQSFAASQERYSALYQRHRPERIWFVVGRPSFTGDGQTDQHEYAVFVFGQKPARQTLVDWLTWKP